MIVSIELPEEIASQLTALQPEERSRLATDAISQALSAWQEADTRLAASLPAQIDPEQEPEREAAECRAIVEQELAGMDTDGHSLSLEELRRQWEAEKAARQTAGRK